jgi:hypothetical protein
MCYIHKKGEFGWICSTTSLHTKRMLPTWWWIWIMGHKTPQVNSMTSFSGIPRSRNDIAALMSHFLDTFAITAAFASQVS